MTTTAISPATWRRLVEANDAAVENGWATPGVFATAVGPDYRPGGSETVFYVGKAGGPLIDAVGITRDQVKSAAAASAWMMERRNPSAFWRFADLLSPKRRMIAWSNVAKIDTTSAVAPNKSQWMNIRDACLRALREEMAQLRPARSVFAISDYRKAEVIALLRDIGYDEFHPPDGLESTRLFVNSDGGLAAVTRHPQGWRTEPRDKVALFVRKWRRR